MPLSADIQLSNILRIGRNLKKGAKILSLKQPNSEIMRSMKEMKNKGDMTDLSENFENFDRSAVQSGNVREEYFYLDQIVWCKMSWGRARVYVLVRNSTM